MMEDLLKRLETRYPASGRFRAGVREILRTAPMPARETVRQALEDSYRRAAETRASVLASRRRLADIGQDLVRLRRAHRHCQAALADLESAVGQFGARLDSLHAAVPALPPAISACRRTPMFRASDAD